MDYRSYGSQTWPIKWNAFFQAVVVSILLYRCTTWTLTKSMEKKLEGNYTRMLRAILNKSWKQHPTKQQLYGHSPLITKTIQVRRSRHAGHCWRSRDELISDVLLWSPSHGRAKARRPARTYIQQLYADTGCSPEELPGAMDDTDGWQERVREIRADDVTWRWWWWWVHITRQQYLIYWKRWQHTPSEGMDGYWQVIDHMEIWSFWWNKMGFLPRCCCVGTTVWMHHEGTNKTHGNYTRKLRTVLNRSWKQHLTKQRLYGHLPPISQTIEVRRTRHAWHC